MSAPNDMARIRQEVGAQGYCRLGPLATPEQLAALRGRLDDIVHGKRDHTPFFFQKDSASGRYDELPYGEGWQGPSDDYRKIEKLERDEVFLAWLRNDAFRQIATEWLGTPVFLYRAVVFAKSKNGGTYLPWHQDGGAFWGLNKEPTLQLWTALDDAPAEAGCLEVLPGTHLKGLASPDGGVVPEPLVQQHLRDHAPVALPAVAGEVIVLHNHVWHRSHRNTTGVPRRAFTVCLLDAQTKCRRKKRTPRSFFRVFE